MSHIEIKIATNNAAFRTEEGQLRVREVVRILGAVNKKIVGLVFAHNAKGTKSFNILDINGNTVGSVEIVED